MGAPPARRVATRTCVACRTTRAKRDLVRIVRSPDGRIALDETGRLAGRGAYLCRDRSCWQLALSRGAVQRALGVPLPADVRAVLEAPPGERAAPGAVTRTTTTMSEGGAGGQE
ncbi:MAG: RNase P modulator RnpM [Chloroflexota bacterium]